MFVIHENMFDEFIHIFQFLLTEDTDTRIFKSLVLGDVCIKFFHGEELFPANWTFGIWVALFDYDGML